MLHRDGSLEGIFTNGARARIVEELFARGVSVPEDLLTRAFTVLHEGLEATETRFFSHKGYVKSREVVVDHVTRLAAAKEVFTVATLYTREKEAPKDEKTVAMEFDENTGVLRMVVGGASGPHTALQVSTVRQPKTLSPVERTVEQLDTLLGRPGEHVPTKVPRLKPRSALDEILSGDLKQVISDEIVD